MQFLERLASADPTPGGGSAAAIMGAMGAALVSMVCNVTFGKKGYEAAEPEMRERAREVRGAAPAARGHGRRGHRGVRRPDGCLQAAQGSDEEKAQRAEAIQASLGAPPKCLSNARAPAPR